MKDCQKILFLHSGSWCYDSNLYFEQCISAKFEELGWETEHISCPRDSAVSVLKSLYGNCYSIIFDINSILPALKDEDETFCLDHISGSVWHYILDHPLYHHDVLKCPLNDFHVICLDEKHAEFIRTYYPHIKQVLCLPLAATHAAPETDYAKREHQVLFTGTYTNPDKVLYQAMKQPKEKVVIFEETVQLLLNQPHLTQEEALARCINDTSAMKNVSASNENASLNSSGFPQLLQSHYLADMFLHACLREELLAWFLKKGVSITVYGHHWEEFLEKSQNSIPDTQKHLRIMGEVPYEKMPQIYANSQIALNQLPWFKAGMHDRIPLALMNGCICLTDTNPYLEKHFSANKALYFYPLENMEQAADMVLELQQTPDAAEAAAQGYLHAQTRLSWRNWCDTLLSNSGLL